MSIFRIRALKDIKISSADVFGNKIGGDPTKRSGWKYLRQPRLISNAELNYYFIKPGPFTAKALEEYKVPGYVSPRIQTRVERVERRKKKGIMPVKKGHGKRAKLKKINLKKKNFSCLFFYERFYFIIILF